MLVCRGGEAPLRGGVRTVFGMVGMEEVCSLKVDRIEFVFLEC